MVPESMAHPPVDYTVAKLRMFLGKDLWNSPTLGPYGKARGYTYEK